MNGLVTVLRRELGERWQVLPAALLAGFLPLLMEWCSILPGAGSGELQTVISLTLAGLLAGGLAIGLGANVLIGPLLSGRLNFYWTRPIGGWAVWAGTLGAAVVLALAAGALALLPGLLTGGDGPLAAFEVAREALRASGHVAFFNREPPGNASVLGIALTAVLVLVLLAHAAAVLLRTRSWLLLDIVAALVIGLVMASATGRLARADAITALRLLAVGEGALLLVALLAATAAQVVFGRSDVVRGRHWLATVLWATLAVGAVAAGGYAAWVVSPKPSDLLMAWAGAQPATEQHAFVVGPVRGRGDYLAGFLMDLTSGEFTRVGGSQAQQPSRLAFGAGCAVWITGGSDELWVTDLTDTARKGATAHRPLAGALPAGELVVSEDCRLLAVAEAHRLVVAETTTGRLVASATLPESQVLWNPLVFSPEGERLHSLRIVPVLGDGVADRQSYLEVWELRTDQPGAQPERIARSERSLASPSAFLLPGNDRMLVRYQAAAGGDSSQRWILTFPDLRPVAQLPAPEGCQGRYWPLAGGPLAIAERCGANHSLRLFAADGSALRSIALPPEGELRLGSQPAPHKLLLAVSPSALGPTKNPWREQFHDPAPWRTLLLDLETGAISPVGEGLLPVFAGLGPESAAARLLESSNGGLLLYDPTSGRSRPVPARGGSASER